MVDDDMRFWEEVKVVYRLVGRLESLMRMGSLGQECTFNLQLTAIKFCRHLNLH